MWDEPSSWKVELGSRVLYIQGVGDIRLPKSALRQLGRFVGRGGEMRTLTVTRRKAGTGYVWRATVGFRNVAVEKTIPTAGEGSVVGCDRGIKVTLALSDGMLVTMPHWMAEARDDIVTLQRQRATKTKYSRAWRHANRQVAKTHGKVAERADNWARETANALVAAHDVIVLEDLNLVAMTRSAKGTIEEPGRGVAQTLISQRGPDGAVVGSSQAGDGRSERELTTVVGVGRVESGSWRCRATARSGGEFFEALSDGPVGMFGMPRWPAAAGLAGLGPQVKAGRAWSRSSAVANSPAWR